MKQALTLLAALLFACGTALYAKDLKPRVFVLTDISNEPDDEESMVRFLVYANEYDVEARDLRWSLDFYLTDPGAKNFTLNGKLTAGYGSMWGMDPTKPGDKIGPEFTFGLTMDAALDEPILIIKTAWGGMSLHTNFRSPSAGSYELSSFQRDNHPKQTGHGIPEDFEQWKADKAKSTGHYYRLMMEHVKKVLADPKRVYPEYDATQGF